MIILASKSPRRKELLSQVGYTYECVVSEKEENTDAVQPSDVVKEFLQLTAQRLTKRFRAISNLTKRSNICLKSRLSHLEKAEKSLSVRIRLLQLTAKF